MEEHFLVTGALGCIGAWVVRNLIQEGIKVTVFDLANDPHRLRLVINAQDLAQVEFIAGDITNTQQVQEAAQGKTHLIHLAALQVPFCKANPVLGAQVNVVGTVNMFEAAKRAGIKQLAFASSVAVFGGSEDYDPSPLPDDAPLKPRTLYGVYKQANEGTARVYWQDEGISSIALRPYTVYGVGRDQGLTSAPTKAMLAVAAQQGYHIGFGGRCAYQFVDDVARLFILAARTPLAGAESFNLGGSVAQMSEIVAAIEQAAPEMAGKITFEDKPLPFPAETDDSRLLNWLEGFQYTPLENGVAQTIAHFRGALADGRLQNEFILPLPN